jgi:hypothetical protein
MRDDEERIRFALRFAERDLTQLRAGDRLNLLEDLAAFLFWRVSEVEHVGDDQLATLQKEARWVLHVMAHTVHHKSFPNANAQWPSGLASQPRIAAIGEGSEGEEEWLFHVFTLPVSTLSEVTFTLGPEGTARMSVKAELRETFHFNLIAAFFRLAAAYESGLTRLRYCLAPTCGRLFLADHGRQEFCSPQCSRKTRVIRFRERQEQATRPRSVQQSRQPRKRTKEGSSMRSQRK